MNASLQVGEQAGSSTSKPPRDQRLTKKGAAYQEQQTARVQRNFLKAYDKVKASVKRILEELRGDVSEDVV